MLEEAAARNQISPAGMLQERPPNSIIGGNALLAEHAPSASQLEVEDLR
jgi:hypothetical protein